MKKIVLAGGCFWGVQEYFDQLKGVIKTSTGYVDGNKKSPTYEEVCHGIAAHTEAIEVIYDDKVMTLEILLDHFFRIINPFSLNRQGNDIGRQYRTGIYYNDASDYEKCMHFMKQYFKDDIKKVRTEIKENLDYELAELYHQDYLKKNPKGYCHIDMNLAAPEEKKS